MGARDDAAAALSRDAPWLEEGHVALDAIARDVRLQARTRLDPKLVKRYAAAMRGGATFPPVTLCDAGVDGLLLVDGWHRLEAARANGHPSIAAEVTRMTRKEAGLKAALANLSHGMALKPGERRKAFKLFVESDGHRRARGALKSYREIGSELGGVGHTTVRHWMKTMFPSVFRAMGGHEGGNPEGDIAAHMPPSVMEQLRPLMADVGNLSRLIEDPCDRWRVIAALEATLASLRKLPFEEPPPEAY